VESATDRARVGLCWDCRSARRVTSGRGSVFFLCHRSATDPAYLRYPPLPRRDCPGYAPAPPAEETAPAGEAG
jgi:hypothetical protein